MAYLGRLWLSCPVHPCEICAPGLRRYDDLVPYRAAERAARLQSLPACARSALRALPSQYRDGNRALGSEFFKELCGERGIVKLAGMNNQFLV